LIQGYDEFYTGSIAKDITGYFQSQEGGLLSMEDLANYSPGWYVKFKSWQAAADCTALIT
jgi:gamma-glutamyltranspeptidase